MTGGRPQGLLRPAVAGVVVALLLAGSGAGGSAQSGAEASGNAAESVAPSASDAHAGMGLERLAWVIDSSLAKPDLRGATIGIVVESPSSGEVLFERNADLPMIPASNMKLVTAACALSMLGPDYTYLTDLLTDGRVEGPTLEGDLFVRGSGDPSLVAEEMWRLVEGLRAYGIDRITGDVVLDASRYDSLAVASPEAADADRAYDARTGALSFNFNAVAVHTRPGARPGDPVVVVLSPETGFVALENSGVTGAPRSRSSFEVRRVFERGRNVVRVSGRLPAGSPPTAAYRNVEDPPSYFGAAFARFLENAGIALEGRVVPGVAPEGAAILVEHESKPLALVVRDLGKFSNNFVAEMLVKELAAREFGPPGTTAGGAAVLERYVASVGADSSGFSRSNRLSARTIVDVLRRGLSEFSTSYELAASLSVSGTDGTLEDRMGYPGLAGRVRAKTGLLDGVTAISGIVETASGDELLFSILVNGFSCEAWKVHDVEHAILTSIAGWSGGRG
jgi:D-alanyl-D-alanine carboxypeptidase/D-alanyl-D-alanine-endopeptidase (penicillin-binding protein 4)